MSLSPPPTITQPPTIPIPLQPPPTQHKRLHPLRITPRAIQLQLRDLPQGRRALERGVEGCCDGNAALLQGAGMCGLSQGWTRQDHRCCDASGRVVCISILCEGRQLFCGMKRACARVGTRGQGGRSRRAPLVVVVVVVFLLLCLFVLLV